MEGIRSTPVSNCHILTNSPALHSLKRQQLVQLCKRNGIKATGKNAEIVEKLKAHALHSSLEPSPLDGQPIFSDDDGDKENRRVATSRPSETWSVIEEDSREVERVQLGLKDIREEVEQEMGDVSPMKGFGASTTGEFGNGTTSSKGSSMTSSIKAFASSLKRGNSKNEASHEMLLKQSVNGVGRANGHSKMSTEPTPSTMLLMHAEEPSNFDTLTATSTPYHAHPHTYPPLPSPQPLDADDSRDQSMLDLGASTIRLVTTTHTAPSPPALRPFTPTFDLAYSPGTPTALLSPSTPLLPGSFLDVPTTPSYPPKVSSPIPQPFLFGSPAHQISNKEFNSAATSVLAEMNARLGLTGTSNEVGLDLLQNRHNAAAPAPESQDRPKTDLTTMFDRAHERQFQKMEGLGEWYARRNGASPGKMGANKKRKSDALGGPHGMPNRPSNPRGRRASRVVTPGTRRSLVAAAAVEETDERKTKRVRISAVEGGDKRTGAVDDKNKDEVNMNEDEEQGKMNEERERERAAIKKKLEISRARRRSSMGRVSVGGGKPPLIPNQPKKGMATKFGFLSSAKSLVRNVWKGVGGVPSKPSSNAAAPGSVQSTVLPTARKPAPNVLSKPAPALKHSAPNHGAVKTSAGKADPNSSLRVSATKMGLGRKSSTRIGTNGTNSSGGTKSSTASSGMTRSSTASSISGIPAARRGPIPSFQKPFGGISRMNSLAGGGGTLGSRTSSGGTASSRGTSTANSIGLKKHGIPSGVRANDVGNTSTNSIARTRSSTLFAPTASSLAKMQSTVKPPSLSNEAWRRSAMSAKASDQPPGPNGFSFTSPRSPSMSTQGSGITGGSSIFSNGAPSFPPLQTPALEGAVPKTRPLPARRPRISRSRVIARVGAQRVASGSSVARTPSGRRSLNVPKTRGSLGVRVSGIGVKKNARDVAAMSAQRRMRQSEVLRRRSKVSGVTPRVVEREETPSGEEGSFGEPEDVDDVADAGTRVDMSLDD